MSRSTPSCVLARGISDSNFPFHHCSWYAETLRRQLRLALSIRLSLSLGTVRGPNARSSLGRFDGSIRYAYASPPCRSSNNVNSHHKIGESSPSYR